MPLLSHKDETRASIMYMKYTGIYQESGMYLHGYVRWRVTNWSCSGLLAFAARTTAAAAGERG